MTFDLKKARTEADYFLEYPDELNKRWKKFAMVMRTACNRIEALERENAAMAKVVEATDIEHQSGWPNHDRYSCDVCIGIHALRQLKEDKLL